MNKHNAAVEDNSAPYKRMLKLTGQVKEYPGSCYIYAHKLRKVICIKIASSIKVEAQHHITYKIKRGGENLRILHFSFASLDIEEIVL